MKIEVRLFATLTQYRERASSGEPFELEMASTATLAHLVKELKIPPKKIHLAMINGRIIHDRNTSLSESNRVGLFPPVGGG